MIFRKWTARIRTADVTEYAAYIAEIGGAHYAATPGNLGFQILTRPLGDGASEISTISWWADIAAIKAFAGEGYQKASYYPEDDRYLLDRPETVEHQDVLASHRTGA